MSKIQQILAQILVQHANRQTTNRVLYYNHKRTKEIKKMKFLFILALVITCGGAVMRFVNAIPQKPAKGDIANLLVATAEFFSLVYVLWYVGTL